MDGKKQLKEKESTQCSIAAKHDKESHVKGETLPEEQRVFRVSNFFEQESALAR